MSDSFLQLELKTRRRILPFALSLCLSVSPLYHERDCMSATVSIIFFPFLCFSIPDLFFPLHLSTRSPPSSLHVRQCLHLSFSIFFHPCWLNFFPPDRMSASVSTCQAAKNPIETAATYRRIQKTSKRTQTITIVHNCHKNNSSTSSIPHMSQPASLCKHLNFVVFPFHAIEREGKEFENISGTSDTRVSPKLSRFPPMSPCCDTFHGAGNQSVTLQPHFSGNQCETVPTLTEEKSVSARHAN